MYREVSKNEYLLAVSESINSGQVDLSPLRYKALKEHFLIKQNSTSKSIVGFAYLAKRAASYKNNNESIYELSAFDVNPSNPNLLPEVCKVEMANNYAMLLGCIRRDYFANTEHTKLFIRSDTDLLAKAQTWLKLHKGSHSSIFSCNNLY